MFLVKKIVVYVEVWHEIFFFLIYTVGKELCYQYHISNLYFTRQMSCLLPPNGQILYNGCQVLLSFAITFHILLFIHL